MKRGQIWVETVIYILIAFVMIGLVLGYALPKINELQDRAIIDQSISSLKNIDILILNLGGPGNQRVINQFSVKKGSLEIDGINDRLSFKIEAKYTYSEPGVTIRDGSILVNTQRTGEYNLINLTRDYSNEYNITFDGEDQLKTLTKTLGSYTIVVANRGKGKFTTTQTCTSEEGCDNIERYTKECIGGFCEYTEERTRIDFSLR